ncbi:MAG TPA: hypothetical protein VHV10_13730 [Ktedonobacteraceae bacterium]|jgi:hypothetical protein|nr:hypothetical protein [Ktedonobacteraceae bacterium]
MTSSIQREAVKAGKHERIRKMIEKLRPKQPKPVVDEQLKVVLGIEEDTK